MSSQMRKRTSSVENGMAVVLEDVQVKRLSVTKRRTRRAGKGRAVYRPG